MGTDHTELFYCTSFYRLIFLFFSWWIFFFFPQIHNLKNRLFYRLLKPLQTLKKYASIFPLPLTFPLAPFPFPFTPFPFPLAPFPFPLAPFPFPFAPFPFPLAPFPFPLPLFPFPLPIFSLLLPLFSLFPSPFLFSSVFTPSFYTKPN